jgi:membrane protease YdiL (CAAX protease family)
VFALAWPLLLMALVAHVIAFFATDVGYSVRIAGLYAFYAAIGPLYVVSYRVYMRTHRVSARIGDTGAEFAWTGVTCVGAMMLAALASNTILALMAGARVSHQQLTVSLALAAMAMALGSGIAEEYALRGILQRFLLARLPSLVVAAIQGTVFSALHMPVVGVHPGSFLYYFVAGVVYSFAAYRFGSVALCAAMHVAWDFVNLLFYGTQSWFDHEDGILMTTLLTNSRYFAWTIAKCLVACWMIAGPAAIGMRRRPRTA